MPPATFCDWSLIIRMPHVHASAAHAAAHEAAMQSSCLAVRECLCAAISLVFADGLTSANARTAHASPPRGGLQLKSPRAFICCASVPGACPGSAEVAGKRQTSLAPGIRAVAPCADGLGGEEIVREAQKDTPIVTRRGHLQRLFVAAVPLASFFHAGLFQSACLPLAPAPAAIDHLPSP